MTHQRRRLVGFIDDRFERLDTCCAAVVAKALRGLLGLVAQRVPGERRELGERRGGCRRRRQIDQAGGRDAHQMAIKVTREFHSDPGACWTQGILVEQDEQAAVGHGSLRGRWQPLFDRLPLRTLISRKASVRAFSGDDHGGALQPSRAQFGQRLIGAFQWIARGFGAQRNLPRKAQKLHRIGTHPSTSRLARHLHQRSSARAQHDPRAAWRPTGWCTATRACVCAT